MCEGVMGSCGLVAVAFRHVRRFAWGCTRQTQLSAEWVWLGPEIELELILTHEALGKVLRIGDGGLRAGELYKNQARNKVPEMCTFFGLTCA